MFTFDCRRFLANGLAGKQSCYRNDHQGNRARKEQMRALLAGSKLRQRIRPYTRAERG